MDSGHPAVGQVVIAETLMRQFYDVLAALKRGVEALGPDGASVYIAEGNRVYPGIWEHLDQVRGILEGSGADVSDYDALRAGTETLIGIWDFEHEGREYKLTKTVDVYRWKVNENGIASAQKACETLKAKLPGIDWAAAHRAAEVDMIDLSATAGLVKWAKVAGAAAVVLLILWIVLS